MLWIIYTGEGLSAPLSKIRHLVGRTHTFYIITFYNGTGKPVPYTPFIFIIFFPLSLKAKENAGDARLASFL
ncbi:MAG: hypothetical protein KAI43_12780, partial [Candidatus Aureabacteria bacterium]|nr:hypothetical protein [Candidatus Auribacterota bacterium]